MPAEQNGRRRYIPLLRDFNNRFGTEQRTSCTSERTISRDKNAGFLAVLQDLILGQKRVVLDLVDSWDDAGMGEELLEVLDAVVRNPDGLHFTGCQQFLHGFPGVDVGGIVEDVAGAIWEFGEEGVRSYIW